METTHPLKAEDWVLCNHPTHAMSGDTARILAVDDEGAVFVWTRFNHQQTAVKYGWDQVALFDLEILTTPNRID